MFDITLTFDNGPDPNVTPMVFDILKREEIKATFFVLGHKLADDPACLALAHRARAEGHWVGNHTYTHAVPLGTMADQAASVAEIDQTQTLLDGLVGDEKLFRPFGGGGALGNHLLSAEALARLEGAKFTCVLWNVVPRDWEDPDAWPETAMQMIADQTWPLVVLHDLPTGAMAHLGRFIDMVRAAGGHFRQDFPADCVPLRRGVQVKPMAPYVTTGGR
ncbi:MAG: polysaccharide deacetylase family protein [Pseudomonadota bacterium]